MESENVVCPLLVYTLPTCSTKVFNAIFSTLKLTYAHQSFVGLIIFLFFVISIGTNSGQIEPSSI